MLRRACNLLLFSSCQMFQNQNSDVASRTAAKYIPFPCVGSGSPGASHRLSAVSILYMGTKYPQVRNGFGCPYARDVLPTQQIRLMLCVLVPLAAGLQKGPMHQSSNPPSDKLVSSTAGWYDRSCQLF